MTTFISQHHCKKCGHFWWPKTLNTPLHCPKCNCRFWWEKRKQKVFDFNLEEGQSRKFLVTEIWIKDNRGILTNTQFNKEYHRARNKNRKLRRKGVVGGVLVWVEEKSPGL